jgi:hypothetical protein
VCIDDRGVVDCNCCFILKEKHETYFDSSILAVAVLATGCTRIETGEVGVRVGFDRQIQAGELLPGSFNQTMIGDVLTFPIKDVNVVT